MNQKAKSIAVKSVVVVATIAAAWGLATGFVSMRQDAQYYESRAKLNKQVLGEMGTINIGDTLRDALFQDLDGKQVLLSDLLSRNTMLMIVSPDCPACLDELEHLTSSIVNSSDATHFIILSSAKPDILTGIRDEYGIVSRILYDYDKQYIDHLGITSFPFNIIVDENLVIHEVVADVLIADDFDKVIEHNRYL